jgi:Na+/H+ antiporter NhaC
MDDHPYGWISILPPLVAIALALLTRRAVLSLLVGILCGSLITNGGNPIGATVDFFEMHLWPTLTDPGKLRVFSFTLLMGAMIGVIGRSGGMLGLIALVTPIAKTRRGGQLTAWLLGMVIFFDDYANTMLLGGTLRPLCDRLKISREKLAYIVDSTAAPIASLAVLSTWVAIEMDYIAEGLEGVRGADPGRAMELFIASIPYRFYALGALLLVPLIALSGRDFGPMLRAERDAASGSGDDEKHAAVAADPSTEASSEASWTFAAIPIGMTLLVVVALLYVTGRAALGGSQTEGAIQLRDILGAADSSLALQYGALVGLLTVSGMCLASRVIDLDQIRRAGWGGVKMVLPAVVILWTASALSRLTGSKSVDGRTGEAYEFRDHRLYTGPFLAHAILASAETPDDQPRSPSRSDDAVPMVLRLLPTIVFLLAAVLSFSTGTSFGTMGLLMPLALTLTAPLVGTLPGDWANPEDVLRHPLTLATIASVLSGAVFGDHCSPISDTTILSSQACGCDHIAHVLTQMPYALVAGTLSVVAGTLPLGWGVGWGWLLAVQAVLLVAAVLLFAKPAVEIPSQRAD